LICLKKHLKILIAFIQKEKKSLKKDIENMEERKKIGILFTFGSYWMGGVIYIINLLKSIDKLPDSEKPNIIVFYNDNSKPFIKDIQYPYLTLIYRKTPNQYVDYAFSFLTQKNRFEGGLIDKYELDGLFPLNDFPVGLGKNNHKAAAWYPDLQHKFYPEYFSKSNLFFRDWRIRLITKNANHLALSSNDVYNHFKKFYPLKTQLNVHVLKFTSMLEGIVFPTIDEVKEKYGIKGTYFIVSNQFWGHKDHVTVFNAIKIVKETHPGVKVVFTGKMEDKRNPKFIEGLKNTLSDFNIQDNTYFVGLVDRGEQLCLMKNAMAIIQPSLFEGWSTVVEDGKALGCQIIASDLDVHKEQLENDNKGFIFKSQDASHLADFMKLFIDKKAIQKPIFDQYPLFTLDFAKKFVNIFS
jgi:glycosyltransferase involved in cell wall biosynthesis